MAVFCRGIATVRSQTIILLSARRINVQIIINNQIATIKPIMGYNPWSVIICGNYHLRYHLSLDHVVDNDIHVSFRVFEIAPQGPVYASRSQTEARQKPDRCRDRGSLWCTCRNTYFLADSRVDITIIPNSCSPVKRTTNSTRMSFS